MKQKQFITISIVTLMLFAAGCAEKTATIKITGVTPIATPAVAPASGPNICATPEGGALLSWVEKDTTNKISTLKYSNWQNNSWGDAQTIAQGKDWFVNWADFPALAAQSDGRLLANWMTKSAASTYAYDVILAQSSGDSKIWSEPFSPHNDKTPTEHGFVSMQPLSNGNFAVSWLDGREMAEDGPMTLRFATINTAGEVTNQALLDNRVCDCCQTSMTIAADGSILVAYRDRSDEEIRDMSIVRYADSAWSSPVSIANDGWNIAGCPINGPVLTSSASLVAASWFTMGADSKAKVLCAFSDDFGKSFGHPIRIDTGDPLGRVDILFIDENVALVSWLETIEDKTRIAARTVSSDGTVSEVVTVAETLPSRSSGFARMGLTPDGVIIAWTDAADSRVVKSSLISLE